MARISDTVKEATKELAALVKEARDSEEDDLSKLAELFDNISQRADEVASSLAGADEALSGGGEQAEEPDEQADDEQEGEQDEQPQKKKRG